MVLKSSTGRPSKCTMPGFRRLIALPLELLEGHDEVRRYRSRVRNIMIDDFRTLPSAYAYPADRKRQHLRRGDDDQSIYSWRGRLPQHRALRAHTPPCRYKLERNTFDRSILTAANTVIATTRDARKNACSPGVHGTPSRCRGG